MSKNISSIGEVAENTSYFLLAVDCQSDLQ